MLQLENDVEEWMRYKILKESGGETFILKLKKSIVPHLFDCQRDRGAAHSSKQRTAVLKREHLSILGTVQSLECERVESHNNDTTLELPENTTADHENTTADNENTTADSENITYDYNDSNMFVEEIVEILGTQDQECQVCTF